LKITFLKSTAIFLGRLAADLASNENFNTRQIFLELFFNLLFTEEKLLVDCLPQLDGK